jgi:putative phosphoribosyl transferase
MAVLYNNRAEAGCALAARLGKLDPGKTVIAALPRGGVPVAAEICAATGAPLELILVRKIGAPGQPELAVGAVTDGAEPHYAIIREVADAFGLTDEEVKRRGAKELAEIERRRALWLGSRPRVPLKRKTVVVVDDGVATGATMRAALDAVRAAGAARIVLALPVAPDDTLAELSTLADETVCLATPRPFYAVGSHYDAFPQLADAEVTEILARFPVMPEKQ